MASSAEERWRPVESILGNRSGIYGHHEEDEVTRDAGTNLPGGRKKDGAGCRR